MRRILVSVVAVGVLAVGAGCSGEPTVTPPPAGDDAVVETAADPAAGEDVAVGESSAPVMDATEEFGSTATWPDGVAITVGEPEPYDPSEWAAGVQEGVDHVVMDVSLENGSGEPVEASMVTLRATSGETAVEQVFDTENNVGGTDARVMPGKTTKWKVAFPKPEGDLLVTVDWNFGGSPVTFQ